MHTVVSEQVLVLVGDLREPSTTEYWRTTSFRVRTSTNKLALTNHMMSCTSQHLILYLECFFLATLQWYEVQVDKLEPIVRDRLLLCEFDSETRLFIENSSSKSDSLLLQLYHACAVLLLKIFLSQTSING